MGGDQPELVTKVATDWEAKSGVEGEGKAPMGRRKAVAGWWMATWEPPPRAVRNRLQVGGETYLDTIQNGA
jgi:hypothetical protein